MRSGRWHAEHLSFQRSGSVFHFQLIAAPSDMASHYAGVAVNAVEAGLRSATSAAMSQFIHTDRT
jgi:hypothetical protein